MSSRVMVSHIQTARASLNHPTRLHSPCPVRYNCVFAVTNKPVVLYECFGTTKTAKLVFQGLAIEDGRPRLRQVSLSKDGLWMFRTHSSRYGLRTPNPHSSKTAPCIRRTHAKDSFGYTYNGRCADHVYRARPPVRRPLKPQSANAQEVQNAQDIRGAQCPTNKECADIPPQKTPYLYPRTRTYPTPPNDMRIVRAKCVLDSYSKLVLTFCACTAHPSYIRMHIQDA
jgi:hypothetical protein